MRTTAAAGLAAAVLVGCSTDTGSAADPASPTATRTVTETATVSPGGGGSSSSSPAPASSSPDADAGATGAAGGSGTTVPLCGTPDLHATVARQRGGGTAGATAYDLSLVDDGAVCRMEGWPGVSFVGGSDGTQIGAAADRVQADQERYVTLIPGARAVTTLRIADPGVYGAECDATRARGLRIYPPDNRQSLFVSLPTPVCASDGAHLLQVAPVHPVS